MMIEKTDLPGVVVIQPKVYADERGWFYESWNAREFDDLITDATFVQDNHSRSAHRTLRGIHYQLPNPQGKLVRCLVGSVWDVAVDLRQSSPTFGRWFGIELSDANKLQLWIPEGFGHAFVVRSEAAEVAYKATQYWEPEADRAISWNDPTIGVEWPVDPDPALLSPKDGNAPLLADAVLYP